MAITEFNLQNTLAFLSILWIAWRLLKCVAKHPFDNIPGPPSSSIIKGNMDQLYHAQGWDFVQTLADNYGRVVQYRGMFSRRKLYISDPKALYHIVLKEQNKYEETDSFLQINKLFFGQGIQSTVGDHHRKQRKILNPIFSAGSLQDMIPTFYSVSYKLRDALLSKVKTSPQEINMISWFARTSLELIGQSGLGCSFDNLDESPPHECSAALKELGPAVFKLYIPLVLLPMVTWIGTPAFRRTILELIPSTNVKSAIKMVDIMYKTSCNVLRSKQEAMQQGDEAVLNQPGAGKDITSVLVRANTDAAEEDRLPEDEIIAQMTVLIHAATDSTSTALSRIFHLLSQRPEVQDRLRKEIIEARAKDGDLGYNELWALPYLDAVIRETLRLYAPVPYIDRVARRDVILPLSQPIVGLDGTEIHEIFVPKGTLLTVAILRANRDPEMWGDDAQEWNPDRWLSPLPDSLTDTPFPGIFSNMMTFMGGRRACIGFKFSQLEMKVIVSLLLESFRFSLSDKEIVWNLGGLLNPTVDGKCGMPLMVSRIEQAPIL